MPLETKQEPRTRKSAGLCTDILAQIGTFRKLRRRTPADIRRRSKEILQFCVVTVRELAQK